MHLKIEFRAYLISHLRNKQVCRCRNFAIEIKRVTPLLSPWPGLVNVSAHITFYCEYRLHLGIIHASMILLSVCTLLALSIDTKTLFINPN